MAVLALIAGCETVATNKFSDQPNPEDWEGTDQHPGTPPIGVCVLTSRCSTRQVSAPNLSRELA